ncbi:hypothetical protein R75461_05974 [Paraburkholderia nemoris]|uniref:hypothetical protein n=1 Tax=Paraburkholderia nemoris TaxID=2793076 RepID=UPI00190D25DE|nr:MULTISPECIES: hypothetical protein [Paraburkholderia]MBK3785720.1 hypothetical protein [Paraburkholderia aspalathi]CAE6818184.1 hypothetical protein R75461_05974 [Paraburkholderia nemoris]
MTDRAPMTAAEPLPKELICRIDMAAGLFASAAQSFSDLSAVFEAIRAAAPAGSLAARLAQLGINNCETGDSDFTEYSTDFSAHTESYSAPLHNLQIRGTVAPNAVSAAGSIVAPPITTWAAPNKPAWDRFDFPPI